MSNGEEFLYDVNGMVWIQPGGPGTICYPLLCHIQDGVDQPLGDVTTNVKRNPLSSGWKTAKRSQGAPSGSTTTVNAWLEKTRGWMQKMAGRRCPFPMYVHHTECPPHNIFDNYEVGQLLAHAYITSRARANNSLQRGDENQAATLTDQAFDLNAEPEPPEYWKLIASRRTTTEDEPLRDITFAPTAQCAGSCGTLVDRCDEGAIAADAAAGVTAEVLFTQDEGVTWGASTVDPFLADEHVNSIVSFHISRDTIRYVVQRGSTDGANPGESAYTDDRGETAWNPVDMGATAAGYGMHSGGLFALDQYHIWGCDDLGAILFSADGAASWADQGAPVPGAGAQELYYVHFADTRYGWCVGDAQTILRSTDGGKHWTLVLTPPGGLGTDILTSVATIDRYRAWVGITTVAGAGTLWLTRDEGLTWTDFTARLLAACDGGSIDNIGDVKFIDEFAGAVTGTWNDGADDYVVIWRTVNGGYDWEIYYIATALDSGVVYQGGNAVWMCDYNHIYGVGEEVDALSLITELDAIGSV